MKRGDYVTCKVQPLGPVGLVYRVAKNGSWADVKWRGRIAGKDEEWTKRMQRSSLVILDDPSGASDELSKNVNALDRYAGQVLDEKEGGE